MTAIDITEDETGGLMPEKNGTGWRVAAAGLALLIASWGFYVQVVLCDVKDNRLRTEANREAIRTNEKSVAVLETDVSYIRDGMERLLRVADTITGARGGSGT